MSQWLLVSQEMRGLLLAAYGLQYAQRSNSLRSRWRRYSTVTSSRSDDVNVKVGSGGYITLKYKCAVSSKRLLTDEIVITASTVLPTILVLHRPFCSFPGVHFHQLLTSNPRQTRSPNSPSLHGQLLYVSIIGSLRMAITNSRNLYTMC